MQDGNNCSKRCPGLLDATNPLKSEVKWLIAESLPNARHGEENDRWTVLLARLRFSFLFTRDSNRPATVLLRCQGRSSPREVVIQVGMLRVHLDDIVSSIMEQCYIWRQLFI